MNLLLALAVAALFGAGALLMIKKDLLRVALGTTMIGYSSILFALAAGRSRGVAPIHPLPEGKEVSDPLVQALALTALVINFAVSSLLLVLIWRVHDTHRTIDLEELASEEAMESTRDEREGERI